MSEQLSEDILMIRSNQGRSQDFFKGEGPKFFEQHSPGTVVKSSGSSVAFHSHYCSIFPWIHASVHMNFNVI